MKKIYYLSTCDTCKRIINELNLKNLGFDMQDIKVKHINESELDALKQKTIEINETMTALSSTIAVGLTGAFEAAMLGTESFGQAFAKMIKQLIARILAAVAAAAALAAIVTIATGGANLTTSLNSLGIKGGFAGLLNLTSGGLLSSAGQRVVSPVGAGALGQGSVEFNIMGDKLYGVLKNYTSRLDRLQ